MTLVEVLVSLVIFALGMLGAGGLIMSSLRSGQLSSTASVAVGLARDYGEVMQLIPPSVVSTGTGGTNVFTIDTETTMTEPSEKCKANACTAAQMIAVSNWEWVQRVKTTLPVGRAVVCRDSTPKDTDGLYQWDCDNTGGMMVVKFGWNARTGPAGTGDDILAATDANNVLRPKMVVTLFGNQTDFVTP